MRSLADLSRRGSIASVAVRFLAYLAVFEAAIVYLAVRTSAVAWLQILTARVANALIVATGVPATQAGGQIYLAGRVLVINSECTGIHIIALLTALLLAYPLRWTYRILGAIAGTAVIVVANLVRLTAVAHISPLPAQVFNLAHDFLFQGGMVLVAAMFWAGWLSWMRNHAA